MMSNSVMRGLSDEKGSWKIICIWRRKGCSSSRERLAMSIMAPPSVRKWTSPSEGWSARTMQREAVVLPQPLSPTRPNVSPRLTLKSMPSTARTCPTTR